MSSLLKILAMAAVAVSLVIASRQSNEAGRLQAENQRLRHQVEAPAPPGSSLSREPASRRGGRKGAPARSGAEVRKELMGRMEMAQRGTFTDDYNLILFEKGGRGVTDAIAKDAGLSAAEKEAVSAVLVRFWDMASEDFARRATLVEDESDEKTGHTVYMITARPDRGREFNELLLDELEKVVSLPKMRILIKGYLRSGTLGSFGANDVRLEFKAGEDKFLFNYLNPLDGNGTLLGSGSLAEFREEFGDSFEIPGVGTPEK